MQLSSPSHCSAYSHFFPAQAEFSVAQLAHMNRDHLWMLVPSRKCLHSWVTKDFKARDLKARLTLDSGALESIYKLDAGQADFLFLLAIARKGTCLTQEHFHPLEPVDKHIFCPSYLSKVETLWTRWHWETQNKTISDKSGPMIDRSAIFFFF